MGNESVVLVGFMGTGKSAVGAIVARKLGYNIIDTDSLIEEKAGMTITDIFSVKGEAYFRRLEEDVISEIAGVEDAVIITGGGAVLREKNIDNLKKCGKIICLTAEPQEIYRRVKAETHRPLLQVDDPVKRIGELLAERKKFYSKADEFVDTTELSVDKVAEKIIEIIT